MGDAEPLIVVDRVSKYYPDGQVRALNDISMTFGRHEYVAIMGPSGSGKSTLLNLVGALDQPTEGTIRFADEPIATMRDLDAFRSSKIGFVFQTFYLLPTLSAEENVQVPMFEAALHAQERRRKAKELLELVGIGQRSGHLPKQLSVGERQRVAVARALANDPMLLLADEPTGNLDSKTADQILDLFDVVRTRRQMAIIMITHDPKAAERADRNVHLRDGRVAEASMVEPNSEGI
jgi:putative ABC transport system ATP-binding protein